MQRHLAKRMGRAGQARVVTSDSGFDTIQNTLGNFSFFAVDKIRRNLADSAIHSNVVLCCGNNKIRFLDNTVFIHMVMMEQDTAGSFSTADTFKTVDRCLRTNIGAENCRVVQQHFDLLHCKKHFDAACIMIIEGVVDDADIAAQFFEDFSFFFCKRCFDIIANVYPRQWTNPVHSFWVIERFIVREFQIRPRLYRFAEVFEILSWIQLIGNSISISIHDAESAIVVLESAVFGNKPDQKRAEITELRNFFRKLLMDLFYRIQCKPDSFFRFRNPAEHVIFLCRFERFTNTAWNRPRSVDAAAAKNFYNLLAEFSQANASFCKFFIGGDKAEHVPCCRIGIEAQQKVRCRKMEETERVRLQPLRECEQAA